MNLIIRILLALGVCSCYQHTLLYNTPREIGLFFQSRIQKKNQIIVDGLRDSFAIDYLYNDSLICWTDNELEQIACVNHNHTHVTRRTVYVDRIVPKPEGLACDWLTRKLYWTDNESKRIEVVSLESKHRRVLYWEQLEMPRGIALDTWEGYMFWTDWSEPPRIERGSMDGDLESRKILVQNNEIFWPNSLSVDVIEKKIYWVDGKNRWIEAMDYDGLRRETIAKSVSQYPFAVSYFDSVIYWTDWQNYSILAINKNDANKSASSILNLRDDHKAIVDVKVYDTQKQPYKETPCEKNNGGCSHLCLLSSSSHKKYSCSCPTGILINSDNKTCSSDFHSFLLLAQRGEISVISLDTPDYTNLPIPLKNVSHATGIEYDPVDKFVYWTDLELQMIKRAKIDGSKSENVVSTNIFAPDGLAIDWLARNLYWTDLDGGRIEVIRLNSTYRKILIYNDLDKPRAVVVSPIDGWLFWSDWGEDWPKIERADLDGANRIILVETDLKWPNGLALDIEGHLLYWGDAKTDKIEVVDMNGQNRREIVSENVFHLFGLALLGDHLFWTDGQQRSLEMVNRHESTRKPTIIDTLMDVMGVKAVNTSAALYSSPCSINNGNCSQFCFNKPRGRVVCSCQTKDELDVDNRTCLQQETFMLVHNEAQMLKMSIRNELSQQLIPVKVIKTIDSVDVAIKDKNVYWIDNKAKTIHCSTINGTSSEKIIYIALVSPDALAFDWLSSNIYWTDLVKRRIDVARMDGRHRRTLIWNGIYEPRNLVLDPREGYMYFSDHVAETGFVTKAYMDGTSSRVIIKNVAEIIGLTMDYAQRFLYWTSRRQGNIMMCHSDGQNCREIFSSDSYVPYMITQFQDSLYFSQYANQSIVKLNKFDGSIERVLRTGLQHVTDVKIIDSSRQSGWNDCARANGGCEYLCLVRPGISAFTTDTVCACPSHHIFKDGICQPPDNFLIFAQNNTFYRLTTSTTECPDSPLPIVALRGIRAIEYDSASKNIFWIEKTSSIKKTDEFGSHTSSLFAGSGIVTEHNYYYTFYDIALEPFSKVLYWSCSVRDTINATRLNASFTGGIFEGSEGERPRSLAIHPERGLIFWIDVGDQPHITQARLDGEIQLEIETDELIAESITIDRRANMLYYSYSGRIYQYNLVERTRRLFYDTGAKLLNSLAVMQSFLYWINKGVRIERGRINVHTLSEITSMIELSSLVDVVAVDPVDDTWALHPCSSFNNHGNCSHLCMPSASDLTRAECACPKSFKLGNDKTNCFPVRKCEEDDFICGSNTTDCIPIDWKCDDHKDCPDGSDEDDSTCKKVIFNPTTIITHQEDPSKDEEPYEDVANNNNSGGSNSIKNNASWIFTFVTITAVIGGLAIGAFFCIKSIHPSHKNHYDEAVTRPLAYNFSSPVDSSSGKTLTLPLSMMNSGTILAHCGDASSGGSYERGYIIGGGGSSSTSVINCPLNPPPSPTTTTMHQDECDCMPYRNGPTPTPCSTDVCDESDATSVGVYGNGSIQYLRRAHDRSGCRGSKPLHGRHRNKRQEAEYYRNMTSAAAPPPPTPYSWSDSLSRAPTPCPPPPTPVNCSSPE